MQKFCKRCGVVIADTEHGDYYHNIRIQYCDSCRLAAKRESKAAYMRELRKKDQRTAPDHAGNVQGTAREQRPAPCRAD